MRHPSYYDKSKSFLHEKAGEFYQQALQEEKHPHRIAGLYNDLGVLAIRVGDWVEAASRLRAAAKQYAALGDIFSQSNVLNNLCLVLLHGKQYAEVFVVAQSGLRLAEESGAAIYVADNAAMLGVVCLYLHRVPEARLYFVQALRTLLAIENMSHQVMLLAFVAHWYWYHQNRVQAARLLLAAKNHALMLEFAYQSIFGELEAELRTQFSEVTWQQLAHEQRDDVTAVLKGVLREFA
jgi:tetratricopeptide (TPR) repeat protein